MKLKVKKVKQKWRIKINLKNTKKSDSKSGTKSFANNNKIKDDSKNKN